MENTTVAELQQFTLFRSLDPGALLTLVPVLHEARYPAGSMLFEQHAPGDSMILVRQGQVAIFIREGQGAELVLRRYGPGQIVGEFALLDGKPRSASARAAEPLLVWVLKRDDFLRLLRERPIIGVEMMKGLAERVRYTTDFLRKLHSAAELLAGSDYERALAEISAGAHDSEIERLISAFVEVVNSVRQREARLKKIAAPARVSVDPTDR